MAARQAQQKLDNRKKAERSQKRHRKPQVAGVPLWVMQHPVIQLLLCAFMCNHLCDGPTVQWKEFALDETVMTHVAQYKYLCPPWWFWYALCRFKLSLLLSDAPRLLSIQLWFETMDWHTSVDSAALGRICRWVSWLVYFVTAMVLYWALFPSRRWLTSKCSVRLRLWVGQRSTISILILPFWMMRTL